MRYVIMVLIGVIAAMGFTLTNKNEELRLATEQVGSLEAVRDGLIDDIESKDLVIENLESQNRKFDKTLKGNIEYITKKENELTELSRELVELKRLSKENEEYLDTDIPDDIYDRLLNFSTENGDSGGNSGSDRK